MYTDGVVEQVNEKDEMYGNERVEERLPSLVDLTAKAISEDFEHELQDSQEKWSLLMM